MNKFALILTIISGFSTLLGYFIIYTKSNRVEEKIVFFLSFSLGIMCIISLFELLPSSVLKLIDEYNILLGIILSFLTFYLGYLTIYMIDHNLKNECNLKRIGVLNLISLVVHNLPEGMIVYMSANNSLNLGIKMCLAIMFHNIPEGIAISIPLFYSNESRERVFLCVLIASLSEPLGALLSYIAFKNIISNQIIISFIQIFTAGLMISLSLNKILREVIKYNKNRCIIYGVVLSMLISIILIFL